MTKKILFIDPIDKGYRNFTRLNDNFVSKGFSTLLVHTSSFYYPISEKEKKIDSLLIRDISFYDTIYIKKVIEEEKPDIILMINLSFVFDRAIVNIAKKSNIKLVYLAHGTLINPNTYETASNKLDKLIKNNPKRIFRKKNFYVLLNYLSSKSGIKKTTSLFSLIKGIFSKPSRFLTLATYNKELDVDLLLVYTSSDKKQLHENMGFPENKIKVVGNPEISVFMKSGFIAKETFLREHNIESENYAVYLDDGLVANKTWTKEEWYDHLISITEILKKQQIVLVIKLHPRMNITEHTVFFEKNKNIIIPIVDGNFKNLLQHASFVISHYSSTVVYALLFNKTVIIPKWSEASKYLSNKYPKNIVHYCQTIKEFENCIHLEITEQKKILIESYLKENNIDPDMNSIDIIVNETIALTKN